MKQRKAIWTIPPRKIEQVWNIGTVIAVNSALEKEPPYPVWVVTRMRDERGRMKYNVGTLSRISDGRCEVKMHPSGTSITVSLQPDEEIRLCPDVEWFWKKMFDDDAIKIKDLAELSQNNTVIAKTGNSEAGFYYRFGKVLVSGDEGAEIELNNGLRMVVKRSQISRVRLWK